MIKISRSLSLLLLFWVVLGCDKNTTENPGSQDTTFAVDIGSSEIPYLIVNTKNKSIENEGKIPAEITAYQKKVVIDKYTIGVEYKGKTSFRLSDKKPFSFEIWDEAGNDSRDSVLGLPIEEDWNLLGHIIKAPSTNFDPTLMFNYLGLELSKSIGRYAPRSKFVELQIDNQYQGIYLLTEKIKQGKHRIDISTLTETDLDNTGGYILAIDKAVPGPDAATKPLSYFENNWDDDARYTVQNSFRSNFDIFKNKINFAAYGPPYHDKKYLETYFVYEYPAYNKITNAQKNYIQDYIQKFETALINDDFNQSNRTYTNFIDVSSFIDYFIINELCGNIDAYRLSTYLYKDKGGKISMGPVWDFDIGYHVGGRVPNTDWIINYNNYVTNDAWMVPFWWPRLMEDTQFKKMVKSKWQSYRMAALSNNKMSSLVDDAKTYLTTNGAIKRNYERWDQTFTTSKYTEEVDKLKNYLLQRAKWMDEQIAQF